MGHGGRLRDSARRSQPRTILVTGEGSHQLTANEIGNMGRYSANPIILVLNNDGYMVERALEPYPDWSYNDLAKWRYADLPHALGCADWITARVETIGELDAAMKAARESKSGAYIEVIGGRMDMPKVSPSRIPELRNCTDRMRLNKNTAPNLIWPFRTRRLTPSPRWAGKLAVGPVNSKGHESDSRSKQRKVNFCHGAIFPMLRSCRVQMPSP